MENREPAPVSAPTTPESQELITVPDWNQEAQPADTGPTFEAPQPVEPTPYEPIVDAKVDHITVIDAQGTGESKVVAFGRQGGLLGTEVSRVVEVQPAPANRIRPGFLKRILNGLRPKTPESKQ